MNSFFLAILTMAQILAASHAYQNLDQFHSDVGSTFYVDWITDMTKFPITLTKFHHSNVHAQEYDWFRYDKYTFVSQLPNFKPNYFISKEADRSDLTIFNYNMNTHETLATYEPVQTIEHDYREAPELHTLAFLKSHRLLIERDEQNTYANVTCIADFLVDQSSLEVHKNLVEDMKSLALFRVDLEEKTNGDLDKFEQEVRERHRLQETMSRQEQIQYYREKNFEAKRRIKMRKSSSNNRNKRNQWSKNTPDSKHILNVRLSFGPIYVPHSISNRLVSCSLDLVNVQKVQLDYHNTVFKVLTSENMGMDRNVVDTMKQPENLINPVMDVNKFVGSESQESSKIETTTMGMETSTMGMETSSMVMETSTMGMETSTMGMETSTMGMETSTMVMETSTMVMETSTMVMETSTMKVKNFDQMSDTELNKIFETEEAVEELEQEIFKKKGVENAENLMEEIIKSVESKSQTLNEKDQKDTIESELIESMLNAERKQERRFFEVDDKKLFMLDVPKKLEEFSITDLNLNGGFSSFVFNYNILILIAILNIFFY